MTAPFSVSVDAGQTIRWLDSTLQQLPFAISLAVNKTAKDAQVAVQAGMRERFTIRKTWVTQGVQITKFSDKSEAVPTAILAIAPDRSFLTKFEEGGTKTAADPNRPIAVPTQAIRPDKSALVPLALYPKNLRLLPRHGVTGMLPAKGRVTKRGVVQIQGKARTFVLTPEMHGVQVPGVYQRTGPGPHDFRLIWAYKTSIPIPALLEFEQTAREAIVAHWATNFRDALERALATAR